MKTLATHMALLRECEEPRSSVLTDRPIASLVIGAGVCLFLLGGLYLIDRIAPLP